MLSVWFSSHWNKDFLILMTDNAVEMPKPRVIDEGDVIVKVTGSTICGSDLHLYHGIFPHAPLMGPKTGANHSGSGVIPQLEKGDVLGHECCGIVETTGPTVSKVRPGQRVVVSFPIACGSCTNCNRKLFSQCERTNENTITNALYGKRTAGSSSIIVALYP